MLCRARCTSLKPVQSGLLFVSQDMTNIPSYSATADAIQLRPFEVLCEVSASLYTLDAVISDRHRQLGAISLRAFRA
jgi:hypothetical protein